MAEIHAHQSSSSCSEDSEEEVRIIAKNKLDISVYKFYRHPLNYCACANLRASRKENVRANQLVCSVADDVRVEQGVILVKTK